MHREFDPTSRPFRPPSAVGLYALTLLVGGFLLADLWPPLAGWLKTLGLDLPTLASRELYGVRFALIAAVIGGAKTLYGSLERLTEGRVGADLSVAVACIAAILIDEPVVAAEVVAIGLVGECLEAITFGRTQKALQGLTELFPVRCWVLREGQEVRIFAADVIVGDAVVVKPGGKVPVDGVVIDGRASVDAAALTGESLPLEKGPGETVLAGSVVSLGALTLRAEKVATQTVAGRVIEVTAAAMKDKGSAERLADRLARYFLPAVLVLAAVTFAFQFMIQSRPTVDGRKPSVGATARLALYPTLAVLVVACPCPLVLATPAAVIAALGRLAGTGVLLKGGSALERLADAKAIAFDKTGTLTEGRLELGDVFALADATVDDVLTCAAAAETGSEHPLARAVFAAARHLTLPTASDFVAHPGAGVSANVNEQPIIVGTRRLLDRLGVLIPAEADARLTELDATGQTALLVAKAGLAIGVLGARDRLRPEAAGVLADLTDLGLAPLTMLTGDRAAVAAAIAGQLPNLTVHADLLPGQKAEWVAAHAPVAFVGDGVNDAPALARATVGIALGSGTEIAADAGDIVMMGDPLRPLPFLVRLSRQTVRIIRQNIIGFGFGVNLLGIALTGWLWPFLGSSAEWYESAPLAGVVFHQIGSFLVLLNSMRLLAFERGGATVTRLRGAGLVVDSWAAKFDLDELLHEAGHHWKPLSAGVAGLGILVWAGSGFTTVNADEVAVVRRFGAVQDDLDPGLHVRWPWPIESVVKLKPLEVRTVPVGFRVLSDEKAKLLQQAKVEQDKLRRPGGPAGPTATWTAAHADEVQRLTDESLLVTGDGNLVELLATVHYTIANPRQYLFAATDVDGIIRSATEAVLRELVAGQPFLDLLTTNRPNFVALASARLDRRLAIVAPDGLGITVGGLTIHDLHPPQEVVAAYHAVAEAIQRRDKAVNDAEAEAMRMQRRAGEEAMRGVRSAEAESARKIADATAARDTFLAWSTARTTLSETDEAMLTTERKSRLAAGEAPAVVDPDLTGRREKLLATRRYLTDFRLSLDAVVFALKGRDKILVDVDKLPGKRHILLMDPEAAPKLPPVAFPPRGGAEPRDP